MYKVPLNLPRTFSANSTLYFIESGEFVKVGITDNLAKRLLELQLGNPLPLRLAARRRIPRCLARQVERLVHTELASVAIGREWFKMTGKDAVKRAMPYVHKATATVVRWRRKGIDLDTSVALTPGEAQELFETGGITVGPPLPW